MNKNNLDENHVDGELPPDPIDPFLEKIKNTFLNDFFPIASNEPGVILMTSTEVFNKFQKLYPSGSYSIAEIANWLEVKGYKFVDMGTLDYEWMLKPYE